LKNLKKIREHDPKEGYTMGINKFADMSEKEFEKMLGLRTELQAVNVDDYTVVDIQKQDNSTGRGL
jgi:CRISPR/Cas system-associated protein endoribonuclease Cas2